MKLKYVIVIILLNFLGKVQAQQPFESRIPSLPGEKWWGAAVAKGAQMPFASTTDIIETDRRNFNNQIAPLFVSSHGRYIWCDQPFSFRFLNDTLIIWSGYEKAQPVAAGKTLRDAYLQAAETYFPATGTIPEEVFFSKPQYNTWIELMYNQNQEDILRYADKVLEHDFPTGIFMVDDNWQRYYGNFDFKAEKFTDARAMTDKLHSQGFQIMVWVCPFITADTPVFREMDAKGYLLKNKADGKAAIINWWNGYSACLDVTNPEAVSYFTAALRKAQETYGIDGFKFDAGDITYLPGEYLYHDPTANAHIFSQKWAELGLDFPFNEYRAAWKTGGQPLVQRLGDKGYSWYSNQILIPDMIAAGLLGYPYTCPDMIGGGEYKSFLNMEGKKLDEELIVRSCQIHALMPMMQFSVAPWRILNEKNLAICRRYAKLHEQMGSYILDCARHASQTNEPIVRSMEYQYPNQGFTDCKDQFMLGDRYLVAPMVEKGYKRTVNLPKGRWKDDLGKVFRGPKAMEIDVPIERLPYYELVK